MANIFQMARQAVKSYQSGGISKKEADSILASGGMVDDPVIFDPETFHHKVGLSSAASYLDENGDFQAVDFMHDLNDVEFVNGVTVGEYGEAFLTTVAVGATVVGAGAVVGVAADIINSIPEDPEVSPEYDRYTDDLFVSNSGRLYEI